MGGDCENCHQGTEDSHAWSLDVRRSRRAGKHLNGKAETARAESTPSVCLNLDCVASEEVRARTPLRGHPRRCTLIAPRTCAAAAAFACLVAVTAKHRTIAAWFKWNSGWLAAAGADHRCSMGWCRTITGASPTLFALLCLTARLAALGGRITAFLKERLIRSGERKILSTITARKLNVSGHVCPLRVVLVAIVHTTW